ncbi:MAG: phosphoenolpyruvate--protein phosphotransferase, partial [Planctomycetes bacterium]|nr:phosphoenolpyruvate--protein phosphotransferase [Planctomycetota bacterium]
RRPILPSQRDAEIKRVREAFAAAIVELTDLETASDIQERNIKDIFAVHLRFLRDKSFRKKITDFVSSELVTAEYAASKMLREIAVQLASVDDPYISQRAADIYDIERRLLTQLVGKVEQQLDQLDREVVIIAHDLSPTQTAGFDRNFVKGMATEAGGRTSHTAIVARCLAIPAVVALDDMTSSITTESTVIIDGNRGIVIVDPDEETLAQYEQYALDFGRLETELDTLRDKPSVTRDGVEVQLFGNIEFPSEAVFVKAKGGRAIGLYRSEFLYLYSGTEPTEQEHYEAYSEAVRHFQGEPIVIRTMDLGGDKLPHNANIGVEANPVLGLRSIRYCLKNLTLFKTQIRAILRASILGDVRIMLPMITNLQELRH